MKLTVSLYAAFLAICYVGLSVNVIRGRRRHSVALGDGNFDEMKARIRAHANFAEYVPLFLLLLALAEHQGLPGYGVHGVALLFILGRLSHAYGLLIAEPTRQWLAPRVAGMAVTFACLGGLAVILIWQYWNLTSN